MGQEVSSCECLAPFLNNISAPAVDDLKIEALRKETKFFKSALLGLSSQELWVRLANDSSSLSWRTAKTMWASEEFGEFDLTVAKSANATGQQGFTVIDTANKVLVDLQAEDSTVRGEWVSGLNNLFTKWSLDPDSKPKSSVSVSKNSDKEEYFRKREKEIKERELENQEKKKKYNTGGMKHTAMVMANR